MKSLKDLEVCALGRNRSSAVMYHSSVMLCSPLCAKMKPRTRGEVEGTSSLCQEVSNKAEQT